MISLSRFFGCLINNDFGGFPMEFATKRGDLTMHEMGRYHYQTKLDRSDWRRELDEERIYMSATMCTVSKIYLIT